MSVRLPAAWIAALLCALLAAGAHAFELDLEAFYAEEYSTNVGRTTGTAEEENGWIHQPGVALSAVHEGPNATVSADYDARRRIYDGSAQDDDTIVTGTAALEWRALPDRLTFDVSNSRTETTIDSRGSFAPDNRQVTSDTSAGAKLKVDSFGAHYIDLGYRYEIRSADDTDTDSAAHIGNTAYVIPISTTRRVQLNGSVTDMDFEDELAIDYKQYDGSVQYVAMGGTFDFDGIVGYTTVDREQGLDDAEGVTGSVRITYNASDVTATTLAYSRSYDSQSDRLRLGTSDTGGEIRDNSNLTEIFVADDASIAFVTELGRNLIALTGGYRERDYEDIPSDDEATYASLSIDRRLRPTVTGSLFAGITRTEFEFDGREDDDFNAGLTVSWTGFRRLSLSISGTYFERSSDDSTVEYDEWRGVARIGYLLIGTR